MGYTVLYCSNMTNKGHLTKWQFTNITDCDTAPFTVQGMSLQPSRSPFDQVQKSDKIMHSTPEPLLGHYPVCDTPLPMTHIVPQLLHRSVV